MHVLYDIHIASGRVCRLDETSTKTYTATVERSSSRERHPAVGTRRPRSTAHYVQKTNRNYKDSRWLLNFPIIQCSVSFRDPIFQASYPPRLSFIQRRKDSFILPRFYWPTRLGILSKNSSMGNFAHNSVVIYFLYSSLLPPCRCLSFVSFQLGREHFPMIALIEKVYIVFRFRAEKTRAV